MWLRALSFAFLADGKSVPNKEYYLFLCISRQLSRDDARQCDAEFLCQGAIGTPVPQVLIAFATDPFGPSLDTCIKEQYQDASCLHSRGLVCAGRGVVSQHLPIACLPPSNQGRGKPPWGSCS